MKKFFKTALISVSAAALSAAVTISVSAALGDADLSGTLTSNDAALAFKYALSDVQSEDMIKTADVDGDGKVTSNDAALILDKVIKGGKFDSSETATQTPTETETQTEKPTENTSAAPTEAATQATTEASSETTTADISDGVVVDNFSSLKSEAAKKNNKIYIKGTIMCNERIQLNEKNANTQFIGIDNADGTAAVLDFAPLRDSLTSRGSSGSGFTLSGSGYTFKNVIVQNAGDCGIRITGSDNLFEKCVFRYNNNSGVSVTKGGSNNTFRYVDSYRNADLVPRNGADADGFSVKIGAGDNNKFYNCRAWENSDDGWDSYDRLSDGGRYIGSVYYEECVAWNNGNPNVFTGEDDYANGAPLDKNLLYIQAAIKADPDFEAKYNAHTITSWPKLTLRLLGGSNSYNNIHSTMWAGNPNGFKFGSAETPKSSYRYIKNCIAFGHKNTPNQVPAKGFDRNNGSASYDIVNALSFDNGQNYWMDTMEPKSMQGVFYSFNSGQEDAAGSLELTVPDAAKEAQIRSEVQSKVQYILDNVNAGKIPGEVIFNVFG